MDKYEGHTPGPWEKGLDLAFRGVIFGKGDTKVAYINGKDSEAEANAKLIADAPMLAERVEELERKKAKAERLFIGADDVRTKLAEQNAKMLDMLKAAIYELNKRGYTGELNAQLAEIEGQK